MKYFSFLICQIKKKLKFYSELFAWVLCVGSQSRNPNQNQTPQTIIQTAAALVLAALREFSQKLLWQSVVTRTPLVNTATTTREAKRNQFKLLRTST